MQKRKAGTSFYVALGEVSARIVRLLPLVFCFACSTTVADRTLAERISLYTDADEIKAKQAMDDSCKRYYVASRKQLNTFRDLNAALDKSITDRSPNSPEAEQAFAGIKNFDHDNVSQLEHTCKQASAKYGRIIEMRADAAKQASLIAEEQSKRRADSINSPINCTSTATGTTVYTRCQ